MIPPGSQVLDLASGWGRHSRLFLEQGCRVLALDRDRPALEGIGRHKNLETIEADLEDGGPFPLAGRRFDGVVVTNYLHRPLLPAIVAAVGPGGVLIYETFARGNEAFGRPRNPDFLLVPGELRTAIKGELHEIGYEERVVQRPSPAAVQRICAQRD